MINLEQIKSQKSIKELLEFSIINIDKPCNPASFEVDMIIKESINAKKTSHFGTLDPNVTGVLPIALNRACKLMKYFIGSKKSYVGIMKLHKEINNEELNKIISKFVGNIVQLPPVKSHVKRQEREREVYSFEILEKNGKEVLFKTEVEAGTYIRKLIHDIGKETGGAHMAELRRTNASIFEEKDSFTLFEFLDAVKEYKNGNEEELRKMIIPGEIISHVMPEVQIKKEFKEKLLHGAPIMREYLNYDELAKLEKIQAKKIALFCASQFIGVFNLTGENNRIANPDFVMQAI